jgi:predicted RNA-binding Zn-ribbon protein involved in translation (DUF1610 family)
MIYTCPKCGHDKVYAKPQGRRMGVYCAKCNSWVCWTTYKKALAIYQAIKVEDLNDNITMRKFSRPGGVVTMSCAKCGALLHNAAFPKVLGQFDLVNAKYCPVCGREII